jgi:pilus assembly protein CpaE
MASARILVVDDNEKTRDRLIELLRFDDIEVVGESTYGAAAYTWARQLNVDVVLVTIDEPVARALRTIEALTSGERSWPVIGVSTRGDRDTMRKAMLVGVRDFLTLPVGAEELRATVINVHHVDNARRKSVEAVDTFASLGTIVTIAGFKGGIGKSTLASNIGVALAQQTQQHVALIDLDLQFGDDAVMLDLVPRTTIEHVVSDLDGLDPQLLQSHMAVHASRLKVLPAPTNPEAADSITDESVLRIIELAAATNDFLVIDTAPHLDGLSIAAMEMSTLVLVVVVPEIPCLRRTLAALKLMHSWGYSRDKVKLVVNRSERRGAVSRAEIERVLEYPVFAEIPDDRAVANGISVGAPAAMSAPKSRGGHALNDLARTLSGTRAPRQSLPFFRRSKPNTAMTRPLPREQNDAQALADRRPIVYDDLPVLNGIAPKPNGNGARAHDDLWLTQTKQSGGPNDADLSTAGATAPVGTLGTWPHSGGED